jgi:transposase
VTKDELRTQIVTLRQAGWTWNQVIQFMSDQHHWKVNRSTCKRIMKKYAETGSVHDRPRSGRPKALTDRHERTVRRLSLANRKRNPREIASEINERHGCHISPKTVTRILRKYGLRRRVAVRRPLLTKRMRKDRLSWARAHQKWTVDRWKSVVFSDEKIFRLGNNSTGVYITRSPGEKYSPYCIKPTVKYGLQVHVWGLLGWNGVGVLKVVEGRLGAADYKRRIINNIRTTGRAVANRHRNFRFQHDKAPAHRAATTVQFLERQRVATLPWAGNSPDMNIIENVWSVVARTANYNVTNAAEMFNSVQRAWLAVSTLYIRKLYHSLPKRMMEVVKQRGGNSHY